MKTLTGKQRFQVFLRIILLPAAIVYFAVVACFIIGVGVKYLLHGQITGMRFQSPEQVWLFVCIAPLIPSGVISAVYFFPVYLRARKTGRL
jgi:hypothetical protein